MVTSALRDPSPLVRRRALELGARLGPGLDADHRASLAETFAEQLDDESCAEVAAFALGELGVGTDRIVDRLGRQADEHEDPLCRESAVAALGALGRGRRAVLAALTDVATVRRRAVIALANFEGPEVEAALAASLEDRDWQVRQAAEDLLADPDAVSP